MHDKKDKYMELRAQNFSRDSNRSSQMKQELKLRVENKELIFATHSLEVNHLNKGREETKKRSHHNSIPDEMR